MANVSFVGLSSKLLNVLTDEWQTAACISAQIQFPPDTVARRCREGRERNTGTSYAAIVGGLTAKTLGNMCRNKRPKVERQKVGNKYQYRLIPNSIPVDTVQPTS